MRFAVFVGETGEIPRLLRVADGPPIVLEPDDIGPEGGVSIIPLRRGFDGDVDVSHISVSAEVWDGLFLGFNNPRNGFGYLWGAGDPTSEAEFRRMRRIFRKALGYKR